MKVALATCTKLPAPDADQGLLVAALEDAGASVRLLAWDDATDAPEAGELVVIRSTWNYFEDVDGFLAWVDRTSKTTRLLNPASIVRHNARKTYLRDLSRRGIGVVPTEYAMKGDARSIPDVMRERGWDAIVIKPVVSAGSFSTQRFGATEAGAAQRFLDELTRERDAMIQPWMPSVDAYGERSLVWIDGAVTHAIRKSPRFSGNAEEVSAAMPIAPEERAFAEKVLEPIGTDLLYARVDVVRDESGLPCLMELELIEPSLYLVQCPPALERLTRAIVRRAAVDMA